MKKYLAIFTFVVVLGYAIPSFALPWIGKGGSNILRGSGSIGGATINCTSGCQFDIDGDGINEFTMEDSGLIVGGDDPGEDILVIFDHATVDPCTSVDAGGTFYNTVKNVLCFCDGSNDLEVHDNTACF